jgi:transposase
MSGIRYTQEFKQEAVRQVTERGHPVAEVAARLGINKHSLYDWVKRFRGHEVVAEVGGASQESEIARLKAELKRVTEERDILKKAATYFAKESR